VAGCRGEIDVLGPPVHFGDPVQSLVELVSDVSRRHAEGVQEREDNALGIGQKRVQQVLRFDLLVAPSTGLALRLSERLLRL
jgi:hypothetical protein